MKNSTMLTATAALLLFAVSCGQSQQPDPFLIVPGERVGLFFLEQTYAPVEELYQGSGYSQVMDEWLYVNIISSGGLAMLFSPMLVADSDERIPNTVGSALAVWSSDFYTKEKVGVGSSLSDLITHYPNYTIRITYIPQEDYALIEYKEFSTIESLVAHLTQNGFDGIDRYENSFICLDVNGKKSGISFFFEMIPTIHPSLETLEKESHVTRVFIHTPNWIPEPDIWM